MIKMSGKNKEALDLILEEKHIIDLLLDKFPKVQIPLQNDEDFKKYIDKVEKFEEKYHKLPAGLIQELVNEKNAMKVYLSTAHEDCYYNIYYDCPKCENEIEGGDNYCRHCSQKLDWGDENDC